MMEVLMNLLVTIILQYISVPNHHTVHLKQCYVNYTSIEMEKTSSLLLNQHCCLR